MRIPYAPTTPLHASDEAIYARLRARRHPRPLIPLDLALLHNPAVADGYNALLGAIRTSVSLKSAWAELAICYIAVLSGAVYEWTAHAPLALRVGVSRAALQAILDLRVTADRESSSSLVKDGRRDDDGVWTEEERLVLEFTRQSTLLVRVDDELFARIKARFSDQEIMELTITVGAYNMVSRFLVALDVTESNGAPMEMPPE